MLSKCATIIECEEILNGCLKDVDFLGQIELTLEDIIKIGLLVGENIRANVSDGLQYLNDISPTCLAGYLVGVGIWFYKDGDFWSYVSEGIGCELDSNQQAKWGRFFLSFLRVKNLYKGVIPGGHRYVSSIILEGGIPQNSLPALINRVVKPLVNHEIFEITDVMEELHTFRKYETERHDILRKMNRLSAKMKILENDKELLQTQFRLREKAKALSVKFDKNIKYDDYPEDWCAYEKETLGQIEQLNLTIQQTYQLKEQLDFEYLTLINEEERYINLIQSLKAIKEYKGHVSQKEQLWEKAIFRGKSLKGQIDKLAAEICIDMLTEESAQSILNLDLDLLKSIIKESQSLINRYYFTVLRTSLTYSRLYHSQNLIIHKEEYSANWGLIVNQLAVAHSFSHLKKGACDYDGKSIFVHNGIGLAELSSELDQIIIEKKSLQSQLDILFLGTTINNIDVFSIPGVLLPQLSQLKEIVKEEIRLSQESNGIQKDINDYRKEIELTWKEVASTLDEEVITVDIDDQLKIVNSKLYEVQRKRQETKDIISNFIHASEAKTKELIEKKDKLNEELEASRDKLVKLGNGNIKTGIMILTDQRMAQIQLQEIENRIQLISNSIHSIKENPNSIEDILTSQKKIESFKKQLEYEVEELGKTLEGTFEMFPWLPEPVYRFLLYGGEWAEAWVQDTINLYMNKSEQKETYFSENLPSRVLEWASKQLLKEDVFTLDETETEDLLGNRYTSPLVVLDTEYFEINLLIGPQRISINPALSPKKMVIQVVEQMQNKSPKTSELVAPLYYCSRDKMHVETSSVEYRIESIAEKYIVKLVIDDVSIKTWILDGVNSDNPCLIFRENGKKIANKNIPKQRLWFLLPRTSYTMPEILEIKTIPADILRTGFDLRLFDLSALDYLLIKDQEDNRVIFEANFFGSAYFEGGSLVEGVSCQGINVYSEIPESLVLPLPKDDLDKWRLSISQGFSATKEISNLSGEDIFNYLEESNEVSCRIDILKLLDKNKAGWYEFKLLNDGWDRYTWNLLVLPDIVVEFSRHLYWIGDAKETEKVMIIVPLESEFICQPPAHIESIEDEVYQIEFNPEEDLICGQLITLVQDANEDQIPLEIQIPNLHYHIIRKDDVILPEQINNNYEMWIGYWRQTSKLELEIVLPNWIGFYARAIIDGKRQGAERVIKDGKCIIELLEYYDTLNDQSTSHSIGLEICDRYRKVLAKENLFQVRCRWEAFDIKLSETQEKGHKILFLEWQEKGKAEYRVVRIWNRGTPWSVPFTIPVSNGEKRVMIDIYDLEIPSGEYIFEVAEDDPWAIGSESFPVNTYNCLIDTINNGEAFIDDLKLEWVSENRLIISGYMANVSIGSAMEVLVIGINMGKPIIYREQGCVQDDGHFEVVLQIPISESRPNCLREKHFLKEIAHWVGFFCNGSKELFSFHLIPTPAPIEQLIKKGMEIDLEQNRYLVFEAFEANGEIVFRELSKKLNEKFFKVWQQGKESFEVAEGDFELRWDADCEEFYLEFSKGVICIDPQCQQKGVIEPNIDTWLNRHKKCHQFKLEKDAIAGQLYFCQDISKLLELLKSQYGLGANSLLKLFEYLGPRDQSPNWMNSDYGIVEYLWKKEKEIFETIKGSELSAN